MPPKNAILALKEKGNRHFNSGDNRAAVAHYSAALAHLSSRPEHAPPADPDILRVLLSNRAAAYLEFANAANALRDADLALHPAYTTPLSPKPITAKLYLRRAAAHLVFRHMAEARADYDKYVHLKNELGDAVVSDTKVHRALQEFEGLTGRALERETARIDLMRACDARGLIISDIVRPKFPSFPDEMPEDAFDGNTIAFAEGELDTSLPNPYRSTQLSFPVRIHAPFLHVPGRPRTKAGFTGDVPVDSDLMRIQDFMEGIFQSLMVFQARGLTHEDMHLALDHEEERSSVVICLTHRGRLLVVPRKTRLRDLFHAAAWPRPGTALNDPPGPNDLIPFDKTWTDKPKLTLVDKRPTPRLREFDIDGVGLTMGCMLELYVIPLRNLDTFIRELDEGFRLMGAS